MMKNDMKKRKSQHQVTNNTLEKKRKVPSHLPLIMSCHHHHFQDYHDLPRESNLLSSSSSVIISHDDPLTPLKESSPSSSLSSFPSSPLTPNLSVPRKNHHHFSCRQESLADSSGSDDRHSPLSSSSSSSPSCLPPPASGLLLAGVGGDEAVDLTSRGVSSPASKIMTMILPSDQVNAVSSVNLLTQKTTSSSTFSSSASCSSCSCSSSHLIQQQPHAVHLLNCSSSPSAVVFALPSSSSSSSPSSHRLSLTLHPSHSPFSVVNPPKTGLHQSSSQETKSNLQDKNNKGQNPGQSKCKNILRQREEEDEPESKPFMVARILADLCSIQQEPLPREETGEETGEDDDDDEEEGKLVIVAHDFNSFGNRITAASSEETSSCCFTGGSNNTCAVYKTSQQQDLSTFLQGENRQTGYCHADELTGGIHFKDQHKEVLEANSCARQFHVSRSDSLCPIQKSVKSSRNINGNNDLSSSGGNKKTKSTPARTSGKKKLEATPSVVLREVTSADDRFGQSWSSSSGIKPSSSSVSDLDNVLLDQNVTLQTTSSGRKLNSNSANARHACTFPGCDKVYGE